MMKEEKHVKYGFWQDMQALVQTVIVFPTKKTDTKEPAARGRLLLFV